MKKIYTVLGIAAVALLSVACNKDNSAAPAEKATTVRASIADDGTKTTLDLNTKKLTWAAGDVIYLVSPASAAQWELTPFTLSDGAGTATASFAGTKTWGATHMMAAFYGLKATTFGTEHPGWLLWGTSGHGTPGVSAQAYVCLEYPYEQTYQAGGPKAEYLFMHSGLTSIENIDKIQFRNLTSIVKIPVKGEGKTLSSIKIVCTGSSIGGRWYRYNCGLDALGSGAPDYGWTSGADVFTRYYNNTSSYSPESEGGSWGNQVTLKNINVALTATDQYFYLVVAPGSHGKLTVTLTPTSGEPVVKTFNSFTSAAGMIYLFPEVDMNA